MSAKSPRLLLLSPSPSSPLLSSLSFSQPLKISTPALLTYPLVRDFSFEDEGETTLLPTVTASDDTARQLFDDDDDDDGDDDKKTAPHSLLLFSTPAAASPALAVCTDLLVSQTAIKAGIGQPPIDDTSAASEDDAAAYSFVPTQVLAARLELLRDDDDKNDDGDDGDDDDDEGNGRRTTVSPLLLRRVAGADYAVADHGVACRAGARAPPPLLRRPPNPTTKIDDLGIRVTDELLRKRHQEEEGTEVFGGSSLGPGGAALSCRLSPVSGQ